MHERIGDKARYATKAKVEHAIRMARLAGIEKIGGLEFGPDGTIRVFRAADVRQVRSVEDEISNWRAGRGK